MQSQIDKEQNEPFDTESDIKVSCGGGLVLTCQ